MAELTSSRRDRDKKFKQSVGVFILVTMLLVLATLWLGNSRINPFDHKYNLLLRLDHAEGIQKETPVTLAGILIGNVFDVAFSTDNKILVTIRIVTEYQDKIRGDSIITLVRTMVGSASLDISLGSPEQPILKEGQFLTLKKDAVLGDLVAQLPPKLAYLETILANVALLSQQLVNPNEKLQQSLANVATVTANLTELTGQLTSKELHLQRSLANLEHFSGDAAGLMGELRVSTPKMLARLNHSTNKSLLKVENLLTDLQKGVQSVQPLIGQVSGLLETTQTMADDIALLTGQLGRLSPKVPGLVQQGGDVLAESEILMKNVNNSFLFGFGGRRSHNPLVLHTPRDLPLPSPSGGLTQP
ncbi:MAG: ABC transporter substrate-binding lipoprotein [Magnetococcales bacterium]|nr:ABC transporter substrate-binding lipoprotein [Magnetococcales bacterium]HIJ82693.1 MCE family protein [Magnetococcales bacterium]